MKIYIYTIEVLFYKCVFMHSKSNFSLRGICEGLHTRNINDVDDSFDADLYFSPVLLPKNKITVQPGQSFTTSGFQVKEQQSENCTIRIYNTIAWVPNNTDEENLTREANTLVENIKFSQK